MTHSKISLIRRLFGRRAEPAPESPSIARLQALIETLGRTLRAYHEDAITMEGGEAKRTLRQIARWSEDVMALAEEGQQSPLSTSDVDPSVAPAPDWNTLQRTFATHRRSERRYVATTITELRQAIRDVAKGLDRALEGDRDGDAQVGETMFALRQLAETPTADIVTLRRQVVSAVEVVERAALARSHRHQEEVSRLNDTLRRMRIELRHANRRATTDALTGLCNRATFDTHLMGAVELHRLRASPASLLMADLDRFKSLNDTHGHRAGDAALVAVARTLGEVGLKDTDLIARYGGEEFAIVLHDCHRTDAVKIAEKIRRRIFALRIPHDGLELRLTASIGVAQRVPGESPEQWLERADQALYKAKHEGRDQVRTAA